MNSGLRALPQHRPLSIPPPVPAAYYGNGYGLRSGIGGLPQYTPPVPLRSVYDVSNPPTSAELTLAFGDATNGLRVIVNDGGAGSTYWLIERSGNEWLHAQMTKAA